MEIQDHSVQSCPLDAGRACEVKVEALQLEDKEENFRRGARIGASMLPRSRTISNHTGLPALTPVATTVGLTNTE